VAVQRSELPERHSAPECSAARRYAATAAHPRLRLRAVSPETELDSTALRRRAAAVDSAALRRAGSAIPKVVVLRPLAVRTAAALELALLQAGWAAPEAIAWRPAAVPEMARSSAEVAVRARRLAGPVVSAAQAALPLEEPAAWDAVEVQQQAAAWDAEEAPQQVVAWVWEAEPQQEAAARDAVEVPRSEAVARAWVGEAAVRQQEARDAAAVPLRGAVLRAVPDVRVAEPRAARPSAVPWVFRRDQALPWPAPQPAVRSAHATQCLQIALP
jgi:hypothetical protein